MESRETHMNIDEVLQSELTEEQREAAVDTANEILCLACAGSGKSRTLAYRIARLLAEGEPPESIVAFTFTEKAAESIKRRVGSALTRVGIDPTVMGRMYIGTIHSNCHEVLMTMDAIYRQYDVLDDNRLVLYLISRYWQLGLRTLERRITSRYKYFRTIRQVADAWKTANDELVDFEDIQAADPELGEVLATLRDSLERDQFLDFSLMIRKVVDDLRRNEEAAVEVIGSLRHLMVDEYQDINPCQEELIRQMHSRSETLFVVGDDDQSIYAWRGADVDNILGFERRYPGAARHTLSKNFRSTAPIVKVSDRFAAAELGPSRMTKNPEAAENKRPQDFRVLWFNVREEEAAWVADRIQALLGTAYEENDGTVRGLTPADFAILMRSTRQPEYRNGPPRHSAFTQALAQRGIPFSLEAGGGPFERPQVAVLRSTFELLRNNPPTREEVQAHYGNQILPAYPHADFDALVRVLTEWGRLIHTPPGGTRRRVYPQQLVYDLLEAFGVSGTEFDEGTMRDIGLFSRMIQDVEAVYMSVDSPARFHEILNFLSNVAETGYDVSTEEVIQRPDTVTVSTVHKMKGLEFPCVFLVDVENQRFPARRRGYEGWLPREVIEDALRRGAYQNTPAEEARLFYTALTRAERYLYVTGTENLPGAARARGRSRFANGLRHPAISNDAEGLPPGLVTCPPRRRVEESDLPTTFSELRYYLRCPRDYRFRQSYGFSPPIPEMFGFGKTVHTAVERLHEEYQDAAPTPEEAVETTERVFHLKHVPQSRDPMNSPGPYERARDKAVEIIQNYVESFGGDFERRRQVEATFEVPADNCVISGSIDLLLKEDPEGRILEAEIIDFKAIEGGREPESNEELDWTELALQVQLYARAAQQVLGENARTGHVHLLRDNRRVDVPVDDEAIDAALANIEWAVRGVLASDFPMRPHREKCSKCDFRMICPKTPQNFTAQTDPPPPLHLPGGNTEMARAFSQFEQEQDGG